MPLAVNIPTVQLRTAARAAGESLRRLRSREAFTTVHITTLALAAWTLWLYFSFGRTQQSLTNRQLELAVRQAEAGAQMDLARTRLLTENAGLDNQLKRISISEATQARAQLSHDIDVELINEHDGLYEADFQLKVRNASQKQFEVSWVLFEWYIGQLSQPIRSGEALQINAPPKKERNITEPGPLQWSLEGRLGFLYRNSPFIDYSKFTTKPYFHLGGGLTKSLSSGSEAEYTMPLLVRAPSDHWLGVAAIVGVDGGKTGSNIFWVSKWFPLRSATKTKEN
jgi:hypothetical protein